jgi:hypothetical protein
MAAALFEFEFEFEFEFVVCLSVLFIAKLAG